MTPPVAGLHPELNGENASPASAPNLSVLYQWRWDDAPSPYGATEGSRSIFYVSGLYLAAMSFSGTAKLPWPGDYHMTAGFRLQSSVYTNVGPQVDEVITAPAGTTPEAPHVIPVKFLVQRFIRIGSWFSAASGGGDLMTPPVLVTGFEPQDGPNGGSPGAVGTSFASVVNLDFSLAMRNEMNAAYPGGLFFHCFDIDAAGQRVTVVPFAAVATTVVDPGPPPPLPPVPPGQVLAQAVSRGTVKRKGRVSGRVGDLVLP